jgi:ADP-ribose pyrophosphatase
MAEPPEHLAQRLRWGGRKFDFTVDRLRLPNGAVGEFECLRHPGGALAVPLLADGRLVLVRQYRFPVAERLLEFPAGTLEPEESPEATMRRELTEEIGYSADYWQSLGRFPLAPGYCDEYIHAFLASGLQAVAEPPAQDDDEDMAPVLLSAAELEAEIAAGTVDAKTVAALHLARPHLQAG